MLAAVAPAAGACAEAPPVPRAPSTEAPGARLDADFRVVEATGQGIELSLPDADGWRREPRETMTWVAIHAATDSRLLVRRFRADGIARAEDCERQMRLWRPDLPTLAPEQRAETRRLQLDGGYSGQLVSGAQRAGDRTVTGHALLFAGSGRECLCLAFSTTAEGADAASIVGDRLGSVTRAVFERAHRLDIEASVRPPER